MAPWMVAAWRMAGSFWKIGPGGWACKPPEHNVIIFHLKVSCALLRQEAIQTLLTEENAHGRSWYAS